MTLTTERFIDNGPSSERLDLVLVAEGYVDAERGKFEDACDRAAGGLQEEPWFNTLIKAFNVWRIFVDSAESGADDPVCGGSGTGAAVDTYFDATYCADGRIRRALAVDEMKVIDLVEQQVPEYNAVAVIVNDLNGIGGGKGGGHSLVATIAWNAYNPSRSISTFVHELGHQLFQLGDEYPYFASCDSDSPTFNSYAGRELSNPNITTETERDALKWGKLVSPTTPLPTMSNPGCSTCDDRPFDGDPATLGLFEGAGFHKCGIYRPQFSCRMRAGGPFCRVCMEAIFGQLERCFGNVPTLACSARRVDFGVLAAGYTRSRTIEIRNVGTALVDDIVFEIDSPFFSVSTATPSRLAQGETVDVDVTYTPMNAVGNHDTSMRILSNADTLVIDLSAEACTASHANSQVYTPNGQLRLDFGRVPNEQTRTRAFEIRNSIQAPCPPELAVSLEAPTGLFDYAPGQPTQFTLPPPDPGIGQLYTTQQVVVAFTAPRLGQQTFSERLVVHTPADILQSRHEIELIARSGCRVDRIDPDSGDPGTAVQATITGNGLAGALATDFSGAGVIGTILDSSDTTLTVRINVAFDAVPGDRAFTVTLADGSQCRSGHVFNVIGIARIRPPSILAGQPAEDGEITGAGLEGATDVKMGVSFVDARIQNGGTYYRIPISIVASQRAGRGNSSFRVTTTTRTFSSTDYGVIFHVDNPED